jgi:hypothetical protein
MFPSHLYWLLYRRRNKLLIIFMIVFCILFFFYQNDDHPSTRVTSQTAKVKKAPAKNKIRINRETYTTPEPCKGCPGENGQGVQLNVILKY